MSSNAYPTAGYPYPDTRGPLSAQLDDDQYYDARLVWRQGLTDVLVRSMASDYRMGKKTEDNYDAYLEYQARFSKQDSDARQKRQAKRKGRR